MPVLQESKHISWHGPANYQGSVCSIWTFCQQKKQEGLVAGVCWCSMTSVKLFADSVDEEKKSPVKAGNDSFWKWSWLTSPSIHGDLKKSRRCFLKESSILSKRIVGAKRKNRWCSWEVSQYTLRSHLTAMYREVIIRDKNIVKWRWCIRQTSLVGWLRPFPEPLCLPLGSRHADRADSPMVCLCMWLQKIPPICGIRIISRNPLTNYKLIDDIAADLSNRLRRIQKEH